MQLDISKLVVWREALLPQPFVFLLDFGFFWQSIQYNQRKLYSSETQLHFSQNYDLKKLVS